MAVTSCLPDLGGAGSSQVFVILPIFVVFQLSLTFMSIVHASFYFRRQPGAKCSFDSLPCVFVKLFS